MKRGLLTTLLVVSIILIIIILLAGYVYYQFNKEAYVPDNAMLIINLQGNIEDSDNSPLSKVTTLSDLWINISRAKIDNRIKGIVLLISDLSTGFATVDDIGLFLKDFRKSGKKVFAFIKSGGIKEYQLASYSDKVYSFKRGGLMLNGLAIHAMFIKNTLSKLGIEPDFLNIGEYKTGPNMFTKNTMNAPHKESYKKLIDDLFSSSIKIIAKNRDIDEKIVRDTISELVIDNKIYLKRGIIDGLKYEDEIYNKQKYKSISFTTYSGTSSPTPFTGKNKIAVIFAEGEIHTGSSGGKSIFGNKIVGSKTISAYLRSAAKDNSVKAVVLRVNSPGGSPFASDKIRHESELVMKKKPLVISMGDLAASGGYMISLSSNKILSLPQTITGSIGVYGGKFVLKGLYDKAGITKEVLKTTKYADMFSDYRKFSDIEIKKYMNIMKNIYSFFIEETSKSRKMTLKEVEKVAKGRVWAGASAKMLGLVDEFGGLLKSIQIAAKLSGFNDKYGFGIKIMPSKKSLINYLVDAVSSGGISTLQKIRLKIEKYNNFFPAMIMPVKFEIK